LRSKTVSRGVGAALFATLTLALLAGCGEPVPVQGATNKETVAQVGKCLQVGHEATARVVIKNHEPAAHVFSVRLQFSAHQQQGGPPGIIRTQTKNVGPIAAGRSGDLGFGEILEVKVSDLECDIVVASIVG